jgi:hypothetical protein
MPVVVVVMIGIYFFFCQKGKGQKKQRKTLRLSASFFLSLMGQQPQSPAATNALCTLPKRALPGAQVRERERDILQTATPTVPKQQLEFN